MISGLVTSDEARIRLTVKGPEGGELEFDAVVDTGYTASLTLPPEAAAALGLSWQCFDRGTLADGSECLVDVFEGEVVWDGAVRRILIDAVETEPLVGMALLRGFELTMQVRELGDVLIKELPQ